MSISFETYLASADAQNASYALVVHGQGEGKFILRKIKAENSSQQAYSISSSPLSDTRFQEFLYSIPGSLEDIFKSGAVSFSFYEGEVTVNFPADFEDKFSQEQLAQIAESAYQAMFELSKRYLEYRDNQEPVNVSYHLGIYAISVLIGISLLGFFYGVKIVPIEWLNCAGLFLVIQLPFWILLVNLFVNLRQVNKLILFCISGANSILFTMLLGFFSLLIYPDNIAGKEGAIEHVFSGHRMNHLMRVRLAENKYRSYLIPKHLLDKNPEYLPRAAIFSIREGLFGSRYIDSVVLLN